MAEDDNDLEDEVEGGEEDLTEGLEVKKTSGKKIVIIVAAVIVLALIGWGAMMFFGGDDTEGNNENGEQSADAPIDVSNQVPQDLPIYHTMENMLVNLNTGGRSNMLLKLNISLELESEDDRAAIEALMPTILSDFQVYLRSLRPDDLEGPKGMKRIQEELLVQINQSISPVRIRKIHFPEFLISAQ